jgi:oligopeptide/dipeptide ABC transporter ATP-binding protein
MNTLFQKQELPVARTDKKPLLEVKKLKTYFNTEDGLVRAVDGVNFEVYPGEVLGLVGESGCGKSVTSLSIMRLIAPPGKILEGEILLDGKNLLELPENEMIKVRGNRISMIFQQPQTALNPVFKVSDQIAEVLNIHQDFGREAGRARAVELLKMVGIPDAERRAESYPHELSGGMAQRVMIAMALACVPEVLIADEPTTALDVTIQAQILDLMRDLREKMGTSVILITHDLGVVAEIADDVAVMYLGNVVEYADADTIFNNPKHPYTTALLRSIPEIGPTRRRLDPIRGMVPSPFERPSGCPFHTRCDRAMPGICNKVVPMPIAVGDHHELRCLLYDEAYRVNAAESETNHA